jgi:hypothetical protein
MPFPNKETQFKEGKSGNLNGRPKGSISSKTILNRFLSLVEKGVKNPVTGEFEDMTVAEVMNLSIIAKARKGDLSAYREVLDRLEGKAQQNIDHTTGGEKIDNKFEIEILTNQNEVSPEETN